MARLIAPLVLALSLLLASAAQAATPIVLSGDAAAKFPNVAVAPDGTSHIAWIVSDPAGDKVVYCRMPRGTTACDHTETIVPDDKISFNSPGVVINEAGSIILLIQRCCFGGPNKLYAAISTTNGGSFHTPKVIGTAIGDEAIAGPGPNAITTTDNGSPTGIRVQVAPTDVGTASGAAELKGSCVSCYYSGGVGLIDSATPITAYTDLDDSYVQAFDATKGTAYNLAANWLPPQKIPGEDDPRIASGTAGTFVQTRIDDSVRDDAYVVRRVSASDRSLSAPVLASDVESAQFSGPKDGTLFVDDGGGVTSVWVMQGSDSFRLRSALAATGGQFTRGGTLAEFVGGPDNVRASTAPDHGGMVVWDSNHGGPVYAVAIPAGGVVPDPAPVPTPEQPVTPPGVTSPADIVDSAGCTRNTKVKPNVVIATVLTNCWKNTGKGRWETDQDVDVNGLTLTTEGGSKVLVDETAHTLTATKGVVAKAGPIVLARDTFTWDLDKKDTLVFDHLEQSGIKIFDFNVVGEATVKFTPGTAAVTPHLAMPAPFDVISGETTLNTTKKGGLNLTGAAIHVVNASFGPFKIKKLDVVFTGGLSNFSGHADLELPPSGKPLSADIDFEGGELKHLRLLYGADPLPIVLTASVWLNKIDVDYDGRDGFALGGGAELGFPSSAGPIILDGLKTTGHGITFKVPKGKSYAELTLSAALKLFGLQVASADAHFQTNGIFYANANIHIGVENVAGLFGTMRIDINIPQKSFQAESKLNVCVLLCVSTQAILSTKGVAACAGIDLKLITLQFLVGYLWKDGLDVGLGCNFGPYKVAPSVPIDSGPPSTNAQVKGDTLELPPHLSGEVKTYAAEIKGNGGVPGVKVTFGDQVLVQSDPTDPTKPVEGPETNVGKVLLIPNVMTRSARLTIIQKASTLPSLPLKIQSSGNGAPIAFRAHPAGLTARMAQAAPAIGVATSYPASKVSGRVAGKPLARRHTVSWKATGLAGPGRTLEFVETGGNGVGKVIGTSSKAAGTLSWTIFDGPAGVRTVKAVVKNYTGAAIDSFSLGTFRAPGPLLPGRVSKLKLKRDSRSRLRITWKSARNALEYKVGVVVADGRRMQFFTKKRTLSVSAVAAREKVQVTVRALNRKGVGPAVVARR